MFYYKAANGGDAKTNAMALTLRLNTFLLFTTPHNHTHKVFLIDVLISHILSHSLNSMP